MDDLAVTNGTALGSDPSLHIWGEGGKNHTDWPLNAAISIHGYLRRTIVKYSKSIKVKADEPKAFFCRGTAKYQLEDYQGAIDDFSKAVDLKPDYAAAYVNRAWAYFMYGNGTVAIDDLMRAQELGYCVVQEAFDIFRQKAIVE